MAITYMVRGADGKEYGPATLDQINGWIQEGRLPAEAEVRRSDMEGWAKAESFSELQPVYAALPGAAATAVAAAPAKPAAPSDAAAAAVAQLKSGASWYYWIAGLSLINSIAAVSGGTWRFIFGLGITQIFDAIGTEFGAGGKVIVLVLDVLVAGMFVLFGVFANKAHLWAFIVGMVLFALDGLIFLLAKDWLGVALHAFVLYCLFRGLTACQQLRKG